MSSQLSELKRSEKEASTLINKYKLKEPPISVVDIAKNLGINVVPYDLGDGVSGILVVEANKATIGYSKSDSKARQRFTIAHELGHFVLHQNSIIDRTVETKHFTVWNKATEEAEANYFAAELLMPEFLFKPRCKGIPSIGFLDKLAKEFKTSLLATAFHPEISFVTIHP